MTVAKRKRRRKHPLRSWWKKAGTMDRILLLLGIFLLVFIIAMIVVFVCCGSVPDTLIAGVFGLCGGECGVMGWIKTRKEQLQSRKWELEDRNPGEGGNNDQQ